ncbi:hypothetical protein CPB84DRAFT_1833251 [Gymnopilus junonius]|uniref:Uncharacterized protein n=1 Tax=Gymnopilus junonius TaxID=109634 RepID=A0A9P5TUH5_GYMJU|nr:hypothetical protein CPB84DRAFT_1833251 [Gymnopilus junonius]
MWCTRWFLPLLLLPLPTAPPFFLVLFLFSLTMHAKPCFYCIVLLTTLFISSCYWQPFPIDSPLTSPWSPNVTTFAEALNATLKSNHSVSLPTVMHAVDRCWCDLSSEGFFEPFNVSHWEYLSVKRLSLQLERQKDNSTLERGDGRNATPGADLAVNAMHAFPPSPESIPYPRTQFWWLRNPFSSRPSYFGKALPTPAMNSYGLGNMQASSHVSSDVLPLLRKDYDLRPYGLGITVDFAWS